MPNKLTNKDFCRTAKRLKVEAAAVKAIAEQESKGAGFTSDGRVKILFERHWFHYFTKGRYDNSHPNISNADPGGYGSSASQYGRFSEAFELNANAAMKSASWGAYQIMGFNYVAAGFASVGDFVDAMKQGEVEQMEAFINYVLFNHLDDELRRKDWAGFARGYNGANYKINKYDTKIAAAYKKFSKENLNCTQILKESSTTEAPKDAAAQINQLSASHPKSFVVEDNPNQAGDMQGSSDSGFQIADNRDAIDGSDTPQKSGSNVGTTSDTPVVVHQAEPAKVESETLAAKVEATASTVKAWYVAAPAAVITYLSGLWERATSGDSVLLYWIVGGFILIVVGYLLSSIWLKNQREERAAKDKAREDEIRIIREKQAHELTLQAGASAADPNKQTITFVPRPLENSESEEVKK